MFQPQSKEEEKSPEVAKEDCDEVDAVVVPKVEPVALSAPAQDTKLKPSPERIGSSNSEGKCSSMAFYLLVFLSFINILHFFMSHSVFMHTVHVLF